MDGFGIKYPTKFDMSLKTKKYEITIIDLSA